MMLTEHEKKMLKRLETEGVLYWVAISPDDTRTLNRLIKKGVAREVVGQAGRRAWEPVIQEAS